jgi:hypothetical protein
MAARLAIARRAVRQGRLEALATLGGQVQVGGWARLLVGHVLLFVRRPRRPHPFPTQEQAALGLGPGVAEDIAAAWARHRQRGDFPAAPRGSPARAGGTPCPAGLCLKYGAAACGCEASGGGASGSVLLPDAESAAGIGLGRIAALYHRASTLYQIC